ncbi:MAG: CDP-glycerol glycerophosphotransferase family protein [Kiritimatiellae bacterium]|nr:CDP-glycerol glycerophosphotransferase family protein [Kiritimatiellia bacterium]
MAHLVSTIIPVYNVEKYLVRCLDSVIEAAKGIDAEIICVNDGSTDSSREILGRYAGKVKIIDKPNGGLSSARNAGLDIAIGEYVMFVDSDDWIPSDAIRKFLQAAVESGAAVTVSSHYAVDTLDRPRKAGVKWRLRSPALKHLVGRRHMHSSAWNKFYRRDAIGSRRFIEGISFEDWPFVTELFGNIPSFAEIGEPMYVYCHNGGEISIVRSPFDEKKAKSYLAGMRFVSEAFAVHPMRRYAMKRVEIARRMLEKRVRRAKLDIAAPGPGSLSPGKRVERMFHAIVAAFGAWQCRHLWRRIDRKKIVFSQFQGGGFGCNQKYIALELLRRRRDLDLVWLARDPGGVSVPAGIRIVPWKSRVALKELASAGVWCSNHNLGHFVKNRGLVKKPGQRYCQTWHGSFGIKRCTETLCAKEAAMLDVFFANCTWEARLARGWFGNGPEILVTGHPRNDIVVKSRARDWRAATTKTLLYVPTFRDDGATDAYLLDFRDVKAALEKRWPGEWKIQARLHPNLRKKGISLPFSSDVEDVTGYPDIQELLALADAVISDYSSCIFDFALSGRPAFVYAPDREKYETARGFYYPLSATPFPVAENPPALAEAIAQFDEGAYAGRLERFFAEKGSAEDGLASERAADVILSGVV